MLGYSTPPRATARALATPAGVWPRELRSRAELQRLQEQEGRDVALSTAPRVRLRTVSGKRGQLGVSTNLSKSPARQARDRARRKREETRWARKSGSGTSRFVCPICGAPHSRADHTEP
jgi:hypothetical protein